MADYSFRSLALGIAPPWLQGGTQEEAQGEYGGRLTTLLGWVFDLLEERRKQASLAALAQGTTTALPILGTDRDLYRGPNETDDAWAERIRGALASWQRAGDAPEMLRQIHAYLIDTQPNYNTDTPLAALVASNGTAAWWTWIDVEPDALPESAVVADNWDIDGTQVNWRVWLVLYQHPQPTGESGASAAVDAVAGGFADVSGLTGIDADSVGEWLRLDAPAVSAGYYQITEAISATEARVAAPLLSAPEAGPIVWSTWRYDCLRPGPPIGSPEAVAGEFVLGLGGQTELIETLRLILRAWKPCRAWVDEIIVDFSGGEYTTTRAFSPWASSGAGNPDGEYARWGRNVDGVWVPRGDPTDGAAPVFVWGTGRYRDCSVVNDS